MDESQKLPSPQVDALASRLQTSLRRRRPRTRIIVVSAMVLAIAGLGGLAWWLHEPPAPPRLEVVAFDSVSAPTETAEATAQLAFPEPGDFSAALLRHRDVLFLNARTLAKPGSREPQAKAETDAEGRVTVAWPSPEPGPGDTVIVRFIGHKHMSTDQAHILRWDPGSKILLVDVEETLGQVEPAQWKTLRPSQIAARPQAAEALREAQRKGYHIGYLALSGTTAVEYRLVRGWIATQRGAKDALPAGPVLGRLSYPSPGDVDQARRERVSELKRRFGDRLTLVVRSDGAAEAGAAGGVRVIQFDPRVAVGVAAAGPVAGVTRVPGWAEVPSLLDKLPRE